METGLAPQSAGAEAHAFADRIRLSIARWEPYDATRTETVRLVLDRMGSPAVRPDRLQAVLATEPLVCARLLRAANSVFYGVSRKVDTVSHAIVIMGLTELRKILQRFLLADLLQGLFAVGPSGERIKRQAVVTGAIARRLAGATGYDPEVAMMAGLLHNLGDAFLNATFPVEYSRYRSSQEAESSPDAERAAFGMTLGAVARALLESWNFPVLHCCVAESWRCGLDPQAERAPKVSKIICLAAAAADAWALGGDPVAAVEQLDVGAVGLSIEALGAQLSAAEIEETVAQVETVLGG